MFKGLLIGALGVFMVVGLSVADQLDGYSGNNNPPVDRSEMLFCGDLIPEMGLGCSNPTGDSGGPNDVAIGVTASLTPPFVITAHYYNIFTQNAPFITALSFVAWAGGGAPGGEIDRRPGMDWTLGDHSVAIAPPMSIPSRMACGLPSRRLRSM